MTEAFIRELKRVMDQEVAKVKLDELRPDDWTIERAMEEYNLTKQPARRILNKLTEQGYFTRVKIPNPNGGGARHAYRPTKKE